MRRAHRIHRPMIKLSVRNERSDADDRVIDMLRKLVAYRLADFRVDTWAPDGESVVEHVAGVEDYQVALATYHAASQRWPGLPITLRQGARVIEDSRRVRTV